MKEYASVLVRSALLCVALAWSGGALAMSKAEIDAGVHATLQSFYAQNPGHQELVGKAAAVLVFPHVTKAGLGVGGLHGEGALLVNGKIVKHFEVNGASLGATVGVAEHSEVILFMTSEARDKFERSKGWTIGADAGVAVASKGAGREYDMQTLRRPVLSFVLGEQGLMGDLSLEGFKIKPKAS
ncbi:MAG TPA: YSC84-related protein [Steroidobacteraceae bacterium]|nr:YSC84-related protein [Steroidobacteraceae bacterium]